MDGGAAAIEVLIQNLINVCKEEISLIRGLDKEAEQLKTTLEIIQSYLNDAEKKFITQEAVKTWLKDIEEVAFNADNVLDELNYHALHNEVKAMKPMMNNALSCFSSFHHMIVRPHQMALTIKEINSSFDSINRRATDLPLQSMFVDAPPAVPDASFETNSFTLDPVFIGRDDAETELVELMTESPEERKFSILAVVGMGGLGKTTLTREVFNHQKMKTQFGCHSWVHVSQTFDPLKIFKEFLASLPSQTDEYKSSRERATAENDNEPTGSRQASSFKLQKSFKPKTDEVESMEGVLKRLREALKAQTYLLVLDDVWNRDLQKWNHFIDSLYGVTSTNGNGIIITTRSTDVASIVSPLEPYRLNALSEEDCWSIIKAKALGDVIPPEFESIGRNIAERCQGLPLAAKVVGGVLRCKSEQEWLSVEQKWLSDVEGDYISRILRLSYDNLSSPSLKKCFAYCSIFPKGERMVKQELIDLWMAEGLLQSDEKNDMESVGDKFVNVLLHNSLLQAVPRNYDEKEDEEICVMHDLVHDLASSVLGSLKVRYMRHGNESSHIPKETAKYLRTLFIQGKVSEFKLSDFKCLHVLSFDGGSIQHLKFLSSSIGKLIHLRKLDISETRIIYLPDSIGELYHLQTLRANTVFLRKLPKTLKNLIQLRHLLIPDRVNLPPKIGRLTSLQTLSHFRVSHKNGCQIEELGKLKNLKGKLEIFNLEKVQGKEEAEKANIFQKPDLFELRFKWKYYGPKEGERNDENVLEGLQPHPNLKKLAIDGFKGKRFPSWTLNMAVGEGPQGSWVGLKKLVTITLSYCRECEEIPTLGHLPNLKHLHLYGFHNVKSINSSFYGIDNNIGVQQETIIVFPVLETLALDDMPNLIEWPEVQFPNETETLSHEVKVFPRLKYLKIHGCQKLENFGKCLENICGVILSLTSLHVGGADGLECLPDWLFHNNQNLSRLVISKCPKLRELPDGLHTLSSLEELKIEDCPKLKSIGNASGSGGQSQGTLRRLWIRNCDALMDLPHEMVESWALSLEEVSLYRLSSLTNLPEVIGCLAKSARLKNLRIDGVPKFMVARSVESWPFRSLCRLEIDASVEWSRESSFSIKETVDGILRGCSSSLIELRLVGLEIWDCLPESIQNLTSVRWLTLQNIGIEELPEWFGNLSSLESLYLSGCKKLRHLGGRDALRRLIKLESLYIDDCPELSFIDYQWRRNNIPLVDITVDGHGIVSCTESVIAICLLCLFPLTSRFYVNGSNYGRRDTDAETIEQILELVELVRRIGISSERLSSH